MNPVDLLLAASAATAGRMRPRRTFRHVHVEKNPVAVVAVQMAGEGHSLWAALIGSSPGKPRFLCAPEPRNRDISFRTIGTFADIICEAVDTARDGKREQIPRREGPARQRCATAPQLLVTSQAAVSLLDRLGRRMRPAGFGGKFPVPASVNVAGAHLGFFAETAEHPGSGLVLVATQELSSYAVTGQSALENAHLGTQLAWWDPSLLEQIRPGILSGQRADRLHGAAAAELIEATPMGVLTDPDRDDTKLIKEVTKFNEQRGGKTDAATVAALSGEIERRLRAILEPMWNAAWVAHRLLLALPAAPSVARRWEDDRDLFTSHADYIARGGRRASVDSVRRATILLADREGAQASVESTEVLEDPLAMAAAIAAGRGIVGKITTVDLNHKEPGPKRQVHRPLLTLDTDGVCPFPRGTELYWADNTKVAAEVASSSTKGGTTRIVLKVFRGMNQVLPPRGSTVAFTVYSAGAWMPRAPLPKATPWTHEVDEGAPGAGAIELDEGPVLDAQIDAGAA